jgi:cytochrome b561
VMVHIPNTEPMKIEALRSHMAGGILILLLMLARWLVRARRRPRPAIRCSIASPGPRIGFSIPR